MSNDIYVFLDIETTGLDPKRDSILEIGWVMTNDKLETLNTFSAAAVYSPMYDAQMGDYVKKMHEDSGLLAVIRNNGHTSPLEPYAAREFERNISHHVYPDTNIFLAGFSVHFDKAFLSLESSWAGFFQNKEDEPGIIQFNHRVLDLSAIKIMAHQVAGIPAERYRGENRNPHRALDDCYEAREFARNVLKDFNTIKENA